MIANEMVSNDFTTVREVKEFLSANANGGCLCPCCHQLVRVWKHSINSSLARTLIRMYAIGGVQRDYVHIMRDIHLSTMYGILRYWGLIEPKDESALDDKKASGMWKLTETGASFVKRQTTVPKHILVYNDQVYKRSPDTVSIVECLGKKFSYAELMGDNNIVS